MLIESGLSNQLNGEFRPGQGREGALLDPAWPRDERTLRCCAWCRCIQVRVGVWEEIEDAHFTLAIEAAETLPSLHAGVCVTCKQALLKTFPARVA